MFSPRANEPESEWPDRSLDDPVGTTEIPSIVIRGIRDSLIERVLILAA